MPYEEEIHRATRVTADPPGARARLPWGAILAGAAGAFAATVVMGVLGAVVGTTADADVDRLGGLLIGFVVWVLLTSIVAGIVGGAVLGRAMRTDTPSRPVLHGGLTWIAGLALVMLLSPDSGRLLGALGGTPERFERPAHASSVPGREDPRESRLLLATLLLGLASTVVATRAARAEEALTTSVRVRKDTQPAAAL